MTPRSRAVFFDVDGVLVNSLPQHLRLCQDKARKYGLSGVVVPDAIGFRQLVARGVQVSPMLNFFLAVGFPNAVAELAVGDYEREFAIHYRPEPFAGVDAMLRRLRTNGIALGLVTSNIRANVVPVLGAAIGLFDPSCQFFFDSAVTPRPKASYLQEGARALQLDPAQCTYVGDQPADARAARDAHMQFLGVTFGWGLIAGDHNFTMVDSVAQITDAVLAGSEYVVKD